MSDFPQNGSSQAPSRRDFLKGSTAAVVAGSLGGQLALAPRVFAAGSDVLKVGLVGCGGRGTGAASQALHADPNVQLTAMGDAFADKLESSLATLKNSDVADKVVVSSDHKFVGIDAYKQVIDSGIDVVVLATTLRLVGLGVLVVAITSCDVCERCDPATATMAYRYSVPGRRP